MVEECAARREECRYVTVKISPWTSDALPLARVLVPIAIFMCQNHGPTGHIARWLGKFDNAPIRTPEGEIGLHKPVLFPPSGLIYGMSHSGLASFPFWKLSGLAAVSTTSSRGADNYQ